jgi:hypothetical protein
MNSATIEKLLSHRGAWPKGAPGDMTVARSREALTKLIAHDYMRFEHLRDMVLKLTQATTHEEHELASEHPDMASLLHVMSQVGLLDEHHVGKDRLGARAKRYLSGGWLEELAWLAALEAGADEAIYGQVVSWEYQGYVGENEIDLIMRKNNKLALVSCKALKSHIDAVHETDSLADHFGRHGEKVALVVSTELFDEVRQVPRYEALLGKAAVLDVEIVSLHEIVWERLVHAMQELLK